MNLSRRRLLAALAVAGSAGVVAGSGTAARYTSSEQIASSLKTGILDLTVTYEILTGPGSDDASRYGSVNGPRLDIPVGTLNGSQPAGSTLVTFELPQGPMGPNNPAALWLATDCPIPASTALAEAIHLRLSIADCETGSPLAPITAGSLVDVAEELQTGTPVDADYQTPELDCVTDSVCVLFEYELGQYVGTESVDVPLWFAAVQCRNMSPANPFADREAQPCPSGDPCPCCETLGKLELEAGTPGMDDSFVEPGTYAFTEGNTSYGLEIYDTETKDEGTETTGVAFRLVDLEDPNASVPSLCTVAVKGGAGFVEYDGDDWTRDDTASLPDTDADGIVSAPAGTAISHVTVCVCTTDAEDCDGCHDPSLPGLESSETMGVTEQ